MSRKPCEIVGCERPAQPDMPWCSMHRLRLSRGWTLEETTSRAVRKRGLSAKRKALQAAAEMLKRKGMTDAAEVVAQMGNT